MSRMLLLCTLILALGSALPADNPPAKGEAPTKTIIALNVSAMAEPRPALRYTLLPELKDMQPGNPIMAYSKCFGEQHNFYRQKSAIEDREKWQKMPLKDLLLEKATRNYGGYSLRLADYAARLDTPDWQILLKVKSEGIDLLLPDIQQLRELSGALKVRFRVEVAEKRFDTAIGTAQTFFALSRHLGEHPTLIGDLVGLAIANVGIGPLEEMLQQPGCPNLYWALTDLPRPFIDLRKGMQGERTMLEKEFALFDSETPIDEAKTLRILKRFDRIMASAQLEEGLAAPAPPAKTKCGGGVVEDEPVKELPSTVIRARAKDAAVVAAARKRLIAGGLSNDKMKALPAIQILLLDEKLTYEFQRDELMKWTNAPWFNADVAIRKLRKGDGYFEPLVPATIKVLRARTRLDQRIALLRHVEAIRLYAAANGGKLPAELTDIKVPLPNDPFTDNIFHYRVEGKKAILHGNAPHGMEQNPGFNIVYHITIR
jgi:hypothetical protein